MVISLTVPETKLCIETCDLLYTCVLLSFMSQSGARDPTTSYSTRQVMIVRGWAWARLVYENQFPQQGGSPRSSDNCKQCEDVCQTWKCSVNWSPKQLTSVDLFSPVKPSFSFVFSLNVFASVYLSLFAGEFCLLFLLQIQHLATVYLSPLVTHA